MKKRKKKEFISHYFPVEEVKEGRRRSGSITIFLNVTLGRIGPDCPEGAVSRRRRRWDRRWAANLTRVRFTFECVPSRDFFLFPSSLALTLDTRDRETVCLVKRRPRCVTQCVYATPTLGVRGTRGEKLGSDSTIDSVTSIRENIEKLARERVQSHSRRTRGRNHSFASALFIISPVITATLIQ